MYTLIYIPALQSMLLYYIDQVLPKATDLGKILAKFKDIIARRNWS